MSTQTYKPLVAIVTPVYNGARFLEETMACVQAQTYPNIVHCLLDNASTDATPDIIEKFRNKRVPLVVARNSRTLPILENWNAAVRLTPPEAAYFRVLPASDLIAPDGIEKKVSVGEMYPDVTVIGCQERSNGFVYGTELPRHQNVFDGRAIARGSLLSAIHGFPHTHCLYRVPPGGLPTDFYETEFHGTQLSAIDMDVAIRALSMGRYGYVHEPLVTTGVHADSFTATVSGPNQLKIWSELQLIDRWGPRVFDTVQEYRKCRRRHLLYYYRHLVLWRLNRNRELYDTHMEWLRRASAQPSRAQYAVAILEWPVRRVIKRLNHTAVRLGLKPYYKVS